MKRIWCGIGMALLAAAPAGAAVRAITNDTYVDSYDAAAGLDNTRTNYGSLGVVKAVTSPGSTEYPLANSVTHALLTLPSGFWTDLGSGTVTSAVLEFTAKNNSLAGRQLELHPLTHGFVAGTGGSPTASMGGKLNTDASPVGADYTSYDGVSTHTWTTPGGDFDATRFVSAASVVGSKIDFDLAALLNDPAARAEIQANGLFIRTASETDYPNPQQFISLYSGDSATTPTLTYAVVPEPATLCVLGGVAGLGLRRRRRS